MSSQLTHLLTRVSSAFRAAEKKKKKNISPMASKGQTSFVSRESALGGGVMNMNRLLAAQEVAERGRKRK